MVAQRGFAWEYALSDTGARELLQRIRGEQQQASVFGEKQQWLLLMILSQKEPRSRFF